MKTKKITLLVVLVVFTTLVLSVPAIADHVCPINYSCFITHQDGVPSMHFKFVNNTIQPITYAEFKASLFAADFTPAYDTTHTSNNCRIKISKLNVSGYYDDSEIVQNLSTYPSAAHVGNISYLKLGFADGTFWESSDIKFSLSNAEIMCNNKNTANGYIATDNKLYLTDASMGSNTRSWYYWSDEEMGWVYFSGDLKPVFELKSQSPCIKLVINSDENLYSIKTFNMAEGAKIAVTCYNTGTTKYSNRELLTFETAEMEPPFKFALWDFAEGLGNVNWYMWSDEYGAWEFLSNERGPIIDVLSKHPICLKAEYGNNEFNYIIYDIYMQ